MFKLFIVFLSFFYFSSCLTETRRESGALNYNDSEVVSRNILPPDTIAIKRDGLKRTSIQDSDWELLDKERIENESCQKISPDIQTEKMEFFKLARRSGYTASKLTYSFSSNVIGEIKPHAVLPMRKLSNAPFNLQYLSEEQGLPSGSIQFTYQDKAGNLWMAIEAAGLVKYNGRSIWQYNVNEGLCSNFIYSCIEDKHGNMFIGTRHGLNIFNGSEIRLVTFNKKNRAVTAVTKRRNGEILFCLATGEILSYDGTGFKQEFDLRYYSDDFVVKIHEEANGNLWLGTGQNGILLKKGNELFSIASFKDLGKVEVSSVFEDVNNRIWLGRKDGAVFCVDKERITRYTLPLSLNGQITSVIQDTTGGIWFSIYGKGILKHSNNQFNVVNANVDLLSNRVNHLLKDRSNNIWLSTITDGIVKYTENGITNLFGDYANKGQLVYAVTENNRDKYLWYGIYDFGLVKYDGVNYYRLKNDLLLNSTIYDVHCDRYGRLWIAVYGGVIRIEGSIATYFLASEKLYLDEPIVITEDHAGHIWIGTYGGGVFKVDDVNFIYYGEEHGLSAYYASSIIETRDSTIWIGFYNGEITKIKNKKVSRIKLFSAKGHKQISSLCEIDNGIVIAGTDHNGFFAIKGNEILNYSTVNGLSSNSILSVLWDAKTNYMFLATNDGLNICQYDSSKIKGSDSDLSVKAILTKDDGLASQDFIERVAFISSGRNAFWGNGKGLMKINLDDFNLKSADPVLTMVGLDINGKFINYSDSGRQSEMIKDYAFNEVDLLNNMPRDIKLSYHLNHLTFRFNAIDWAAPNKISYQYMIAGIDNDWSNSGNENYADYRNIPPGEYTFKVRAMGNIKKWGKPLEFHFVILSPFWKTWWFISLVIIFIIALVYLLFKWRINLIKTRQHQFSGRLIKAQEDERTRISRELHDSIGQHLMLLNIKSGNTLQEEILPILEEVRALSRNLAPINIDKVGLNKLISELTTGISSKTDIFFSNDTDSIDLINEVDVKFNLFRIIQEATNNIIRHSGAKNARITFETKNGFHILTIIDDGVGFNVKSGQVINSVGLVSLRERTELLKGVLRIQSNTNGTKIEIKFPEKHN